MREVVNEIGYLVREGCGWRAIPHDLPKSATCRHYYDRFRAVGTWARVHDVLRERVRTAAARDPTPSAAVLDSQSVRAEKGGTAGTTRASG